MNYHFLKTEAEFYGEVERGVKTFELRKNDRDYKVGDIVILKETTDGKHTGRQLPPKMITYILHGPIFGLPEGYCIFQLR
jgi:ParB family transcriptional regulator, chromosome partitioning protein